MSGVPAGWDVTAARPGVVEDRVDVVSERAAHTTTLQHNTPVSGHCARPVSASVSEWVSERGAGL